MSEREGSPTDQARWAQWDDLRARQAEATTLLEQLALKREEEELRDKGIGELLIEDWQSPKNWMWLSFADASLPTGEQFLGVAIVEAGGVMEAAMVAKVHGINPGGEVKAIDIPPEHVPDEQYRYRLLSREELDEAGLA
jgi:hypothetical protein